MSGPRVVRFEATAAHLLTLDDAARLAAHLTGGGVAVLPTDTGPMLAVDGLNPVAVERVYELKGRPASNPIHVVVSGVEMARRVVRTTSPAERAMARLLPGPLTVVCPAQPGVPDRLTAGTGTLGVRVPDSPVPVLLAALTGTPLTATSLNLSGQSPYGPVEELLASLHWRDGEEVHLVSDPTLPVGVVPSTVVTFVTEGWRVLREGPISSAQIAELIR